MRVKCINASDSMSLTEGEIYEVAAVNPDTYYLKGGGGPWFKWRFEEVPEPTTVPSAPTVASTPTVVPEEPPFDFDAYNGIKRK